jgi:predicted ArsR family transcriptional regulator
MPTFEFTGPDGKTYDVTGPEGATAEDAFSNLQQHLGQQKPPMPSSSRVNSPSQNWSNIGAESLSQAGVRPYLDPTKVAVGAIAMNQIPGNVGDEVMAGVENAKGNPNGLEFTRDVRQRFAQDHPIIDFATSLPANILATMATGNPASLGGKVAQGAAVGAVEGFGAGEGVADRAGKGLLGGLAGAGTSLLFGGLGSYLNKKALPPEARGADFVQNIADRSGADVNALPATTKPLTSAEALGPHAQTQLMALARREGQTGNALAPAMAERGAGRAERVLDDMASSAGIHPDAAKGNIDGLVTAGQAKAGPLFKAALSQPGPVWNPELARLAERPAIRKAMALAAEDLRNGDINPSSMGLEIDPMMGATGATQLQPTAEAWDAIRKSLARTVERDPFGKPIPDSVSRGNHNVNKSTRDLTDALKAAIPGYGEALAESGEYLSAKSAFDQGQKTILNGNVTEQQFAANLKRMGSGEREALKGGIANKLFEMAQNGKLAPKQFLTPRAQAKLELALGPQQAKAFVQNLEQESAMLNFERRAGPATGSPTAMLTQAMKDQDNFGQSQMAQDATAAIMSGKGVKGTVGHMAGNMAMRGGTKILDALRTSGLTPEGRDAAGKLLMLPPQDLAAALRAANTGPKGPLSAAARALYLSGPALAASAPLLLLQRAGGQ